MEQPISRKQHAFADFSYIPAVACLPSIAGFEDEKKSRCRSPGFERQCGCICIFYKS